MYYNGKTKTHDFMTASLIVGHRLIATTSIHIGGALTSRSSYVFATNFVELVYWLNAATRDSEHLFGSLEFLTILIAATTGFEN